MKKQSIFLTLMLLAVILLVGCTEYGYKDNPVNNEAAKETAAKKILGKWILTQTGNKKVEETGKYAILTFDSEGKAIYNGTLGEGDKDMNEESTYKFESDWKEEGDALSGHVYFKIWGGQYDDNDRFSCVFINDEMRLVRENYPDAISATAPIVYYFARSEYAEDMKEVNVDFRLENEAGVESYTYNEGENIVFRLEIKNNGTKTVILPSKSAIIGGNLFRVFSAADKKDLGTPWNQKADIYTTMQLHTLLGSNSSMVYVCPWLNKSETSLNPDLYSFFKLDGTKPLTAGEYYSEFDINLSDTHKVTCKREFKIQKL